MVDASSPDYYRQICREYMLMQSKGYRIIHFLTRSERAVDNEKFHTFLKDQNLV